MNTELKALGDSQEDHERVIHLNTLKKKYARDLESGDVFRALAGQPATIVSVKVMHIADLEYMIVKGYYTDGTSITNRFKSDSIVEVY